MVSPGLAASMRFWRLPAEVPIVVVAVPLLFTGFPSAVLLVTLAVLSNTPAVDAVTVSVMVALQPGSSVPRLQVTVVEPVQLPRLVVAEANVRSVGSTSVMTTSVAVAGPQLTTAML